MSGVSLDEIMAAEPRLRGRDGRIRGLRADVRTARNDETKTRSQLARNLATTALRRLHAEDYEALVRQARAKVDADRGPLPGDEPSVAS